MNEHTPTIKLVTIRQAAEMLGVHEETVRRWIKAGKLEKVEIGPYKRPRINVASVLKQIQGGLL